MTKHLRRALTGAVCAAATLALAACGSSGSPTAVAGVGATDSASADPAASTQAASPTDGLPQGPKLASWLLPAKDLPKLKLDPSGTQDSGTVYNQPTPIAMSKAAACPRLGQTGWIDLGGHGSASFAQNDYTDAYSDEFAQEIDSYEGAGAQAAMAQLRKVFAECGTFKLPINGSQATAKLKFKSLTGIGNEAVEATILLPGYTGGTTLIAARVGKLVVTTLYNDQNSTGSADVSLTRRLVKGLPAA